MVKSALSLVEATRDDLPALYAIAGASLVYEQFSADLLAEKLFTNPAPQRYAGTTLCAIGDGRIRGFMQIVWRGADARGWIGVFAVEPAWRRRGVASALLAAALAQLSSQGVRDVEALAIPTNYLTPGLDPRYTAALTLLERSGFVRSGDCANLRVALDQDWDAAQHEQSLRAAGVELRRAAAEDVAALDAFFETEFGADWSIEVRQALANDPPAVHLAWAAGEIIAFSAHSSQNREWGLFGPMGTRPAARGRGVGGVLLQRCLRDLRDAGHATAVIPWVGPIAFYARTVGAQVDRVFWRYRRAME